MLEPQATNPVAYPAPAETGAGAIARRSRPYLAGIAASWALAELLASTGLGVSPALAVRGLLELLFFSFAALGLFVLHWASGRPRREVLAAGGLGSVLAVAFAFAVPRGVLEAPGIGLGLGSALVLGIRALRARGEKRGATLDVLVPGLLLPAFVFVSGFFLQLTAALRPGTYDAFALATDGALGFQPAWAAGRLFAAAPALAVVARIVYIALPLAFVAVQAATLRTRRPVGPDPMTAFLAVALAGYAFYFAFPVVGPAFLGPGFPAQPPPRLALELVRPAPLPRNCMPSLHTAWALTAFLLARPYRPALRALTGGFLAFTLLATLGTGYHYLVDLVAAVPFTAAVYAAVAPVAPGAASARRNTIAAAAVLFIAWLAMVRFAPGRLPGGLLWLFAAAVVALPAVGVARLQRALLGPLQAPPTAGDRSLLAARLRAGVAGVFFLSGFAALCYEVVFAKAFAVTYGSTARATTTVLAVYMAGLALGSWMGGKIATRVARPLRAFAIVELAVGGWCALFPVAIGLVRAAYLAIATGANPAAAWLVPVQMGLQAAALLPATLLMGCSLPLLARHFTDRDEAVGSAVGRLYLVNTAGAAAGTALAGYLLLPLLGVTRTVLFAVALDALAAVLALRLSRKTEGGAAAPGARATAAPSVEALLPDRLHRFGWMALAITFVGGALTFALETVYIHLLAVVAGNSAYAFSLMVFAFLVGLSAGAAAGRKLLRSGWDLPRLLAALQLGLAALILVTVYLWAGIPGHFAMYNGYPLARTFAAREAIRFVACSAAMIPPAVLIGAAYPVVMAWVGAANPGRAIAAIGRAGALNTAGNIVGALIGGFALIPLFGSLRAIHVLAGGAAALGALALAAAQGRSARWVLPFGAIAALFTVQPRAFDLTRLASGANVYFAEQSYGRVIDHAESQDGGLTTIAEAPRRDGGRVVTMLTNGKFQGDDGHDREMIAQQSFTLLPLLHTPARGDALVVGLGTGVSAGVASDAGFRSVHVAELARDVVDLADRYFRSVNGGVLSRPSTVVHIADGRNLLALDPRRYDFVGLEVSSIWFAGAASLYNREFYETVRARLADRGVFQQWIQLHHLSRADVLSILASVRSEFPRVWLYFAPNQGVIVACAWDCRPGPQSIARLGAEPGLAEALRSVGGPARLLEQRILGPDDVDRLLASAHDDGLAPEDVVSTDDNLLLEYSTPRGNVRDYATSLADNLAYLRRFASGSPLSGTALTQDAFDALRVGPR